MDGGEVALELCERSVFPLVIERAEQPRELHDVGEEGRRGGLQGGLGEKAGEKSQAQRLNQDQNQGRFGRPRYGCEVGAVRVAPVLSRVDAVAARRGSDASKKTWM